MCPRVFLGSTVLIAWTPPSQIRTYTYERGERHSRGNTNEAVFEFVIGGDALCTNLQSGAVEAAGDEGQSVPVGRRVFYASHSLMWYVPEPLGELATAKGIAGHELLGLQKLGASRTLQHWNLPDTENLAKRALATGNVDVLVMSPIQFPDEGVENFVRLGLQYNSRMHFLVQLSWGGGDVDNQDFPKGAWDNVDRDKSPEELEKLFVRNIQAGEAQADAINEKYGNGKKVLLLVPTAQALVELRSRIYRKEIPGLTDQGDLFVDPAHPSAPLETLNAYLHFAVLYRRSPVGLPMPQLLRKANRDQWDDTFNTTLQEIAWKSASHYSYAGIELPNDSDHAGIDDVPDPGERRGKTVSTRNGEAVCR